MARHLRDLNLRSVDGYFGLHFQKTAKAACGRQVKKHLIVPKDFDCPRCRQAVYDHIQQLERYKQALTDKDTARFFSELIKPISDEIKACSALLD